MNHANLDTNTYALRLDPGDDVLAKLESFCSENQIDNASVAGIGSFESPTIAHYSIRTKQFTDKSLEGIHEVTSLLGNISLVDGKPFAHLHVNVAGPDMQTLGGHLVKGVCSATLELVLTAYPSHHWKVPNDGIGLKIWDFRH
jgi:uncharacterized protein